MRKKAILRGRPHNREELKKIFGMSEREMRQVDETVARMIEAAKRGLEATVPSPVAGADAAKPLPRRRPAA